MTNRSSSHRWVYFFIQNGFAANASILSYFKGSWGATPTVWPMLAYELLQGELKMFGRSKKIESGVLLKTHTTISDVAQDTVERIVKERMRWVGLTVRFAYEGPCPNGQKYTATVRGYCRVKGTHGVSATFKVCVFGTDSVVFDEGACHTLAFEYQHEFWHHYLLRIERDGSILTKPSPAFYQDPLSTSDGTELVLTEK